MKRGPIVEDDATRGGQGLVACSCTISGSSSGRATSARRPLVGLGCPTIASGRPAATVTYRRSAASTSSDGGAIETITVWS